MHFYFVLGWHCLWEHLWSFNSRSPCSSFLGTIILCRCYLFFKIVGRFWEPAADIFRQEHFFLFLFFLFFLHDCYFLFELPKANKLDFLLVIILNMWLWYRDSSFRDLNLFHHYDWSINKCKKFRMEFKTITKKNGLRI